jgi:8-hydroxy-5-deazaflavin:NADPH oxidoreductase
MWPMNFSDIINSRDTEMFLALWVRLWGVIGHPHFNIHVVRGS